MARNKFVIYQCKEINNLKKSERIFKLPAFWIYETIGIALASLEESVSKMKIENDCVSILYDWRHQIYGGGLEFQELADTSIVVTLIMSNGKEKIFECQKIGEDTANSNITKKLPIILSCNDVQDYEKVLRSNYTPYKEYFYHE